MKTMREALEAVLETAEWAPKNGRYMDAWRMCVEAAKAALSAPVASDARELALDLAHGLFEPSGDVRPVRDAFLIRAASLLERFSAERERKVREEEREACAERAEIFYRQDCGGCGEFETIHEGCIGAIESGNTVLTKHAYGCSHIKELRAAIKEAGNGKV